MIERAAVLRRLVRAASALAVVPATLSPVLAWAAESDAHAAPAKLLGSTALGPALLGMAAVGSLGWLRRQLNGDASPVRADSERLEALLATAPQAYCAWDGDGPTASASALSLLGLEQIDGIDDVASTLAGPDATALREAFARLQAEGAPFQLTAAAADGVRRIEITGRRAPGVRPAPLDVRWLADGTKAAATAAEAAACGAQQAELHTRLDGLPFPVWARRADLSLAWVNKAYIRAVDSMLDDVLRQQSEFAAGAVGEGGRALARRAVAEGAPVSESHRVVVEGERRLIRFHETPLPDGTVLGYAIDMTELAEARAELDRHVAASSELLEHLQTAIAVYGPDKRLSFYNQAYASLFTLDEAWLETRPSLGEVLEDLRERRKLPEYADFRAFRKAESDLFTTLIEPQEDLLHLPDGTTLRRVVIPHPFGGLMHILEDVTSRLTLERSYNTLVEVQRETLDNLAEGIAVYGSDGRLRLSNPAFARIWGMPPETLASEPHVAEVIDRMRPYFDADADWEALRLEMIGGALERQVTRRYIDRTDGSRLDYSTMPLPDGGVLNSYLDVTDSAMVEQALRASNKALETADRLKSEFIANVSYQLRTPLTSIKGFAQMLKLAEVTGPLGPRQAGYIDDIIEASTSLEALIGNIIDIATIEAGYMALELKTVDVRSLLDSVFDVTREWAGKRSLRVAVDCPDGVGTIEADERRLKQVLYNLVSNAVKFTEPGGAITLSAERLGDGVRLTVADTGIGIPEADQERAFGRFERVHPHLSQSGVGLGLALVRRFVEMHGGTVELDSEPGRGTTVRCTLPEHPLPTLLPGDTGPVAA